MWIGDSFEMQVISVPYLSVTTPITSEFKGKRSMRIGEWILHAEPPPRIYIGTLGGSVPPLIQIFASEPSACMFTFYKVIHLVCPLSLAVGFMVHSAVFPGAVVIPLGTSTIKEQFSLKEQITDGLRLLQDATPSMFSWLQSFPVP